ncbi:MAG: hypothetical protein WB765_01360 [Acidimicrobiales bacterium]
MIAVHVLAVIGGIVVVLATLISALETVVLPRERFTHIARFVFAVVDRLLIRKWRNKDREANLRALYAPVALVSLPLVWMAVVTAGFSFIYWGTGHESATRAFKVSGSSLFTLGFAEPDGFGRIWLTFVEATIGLGLVALLISYLPTIYAAHHEREKGITALRPFSGTPADPVGLLGNLQRVGALDNPDLWRTATNWLLELDQTHSSFPALSYFPEATPEQSWVASVGTMLDGAALLISVSWSTGEEFPTDADKGPMLALAYGIPAMARIGSAASLPIDRGVLAVNLMSRFGEPAPEVSIRREEYLAALERLPTLVTVADEELEACWRRFAWIRSGYDRALRGLAGLTMATTAPWTTDRPATVGRPRLVTQRPIRVDWGFEGTGATEARPAGSARVD